MKRSSLAMASRRTAVRVLVLLLGATATLGATTLSATTLGAQAVEELTIGGTGAALGAMKKLGEEFARGNPNHRVTVLSYIGSTGALLAVAKGSIDIGLSGRLPKKDERQFPIQLRHYANTPVVIAVHPGVRDTRLSHGQLADIYAGRQQFWSDGTPVRVILRPSRDTDNDHLRDFSPAMRTAVDVALARPGMRSEPTDQQAVEALESTPGAIGSTTLGLLVSEQRRARVIPVGGLEPTMEALAAGRYPLVKPLYLVLQKTPSPAVQAFVAFVDSPRGRQILTDNAQLPAKAQRRDGQAELHGNQAQLRGDQAELRSDR